MKIKTLFIAALSVVTASAQNDTVKVHQLSDVVVTGTRTATTSRNIPATVNVIGRETLTENERVNILPTLTEQVPGLFVTGRGMMGYGVSNGAAGGINLRGISAGNGQLLVLIDGQPQYQGIYGHSISDSYQTMMAERVEVMRGPASMLYGSNAMGGVINIITNSPKTNGSRTHINLGAGSWGTFQSEAMNVTRAGKFSSTVAAQYSRTDNHRPNMGFEQYGGYAKVGLDFNANWNIFADIDLTHFNSSYPGSVSAPMNEANQWITRGVTTLALENHYGRTNGRFSIYHNFGRHKINDGYAEGGTPQNRLFRSNDALTGVSLYQSANLWKGSHVTLGFDYQHIYGRAYYTDRHTGEVMETQNKQSARENMDDIATYADIRQDFTSWFTVDAGIRVDRHTVSGTEWIPQFGMVFRPLQTAEVKLTAAKGFRNPTLKEMYLYPPSNEDLLPERLWNYEIAWSHRLAGGRLHYGVNLFMIKGDNIIQTINKKNVNTGEISNRGVEVEATWAVNSHWTLTSNHSFLHMDHHVVAAPEYKGFVGVNMKYGKWTATTGLQQISGLFTEVGKDKDTKENFTLLNATVGFQPCKVVKLWVKGDNLLWQKYEINAGYPMPLATFMTGINIMF